MENEGLLMIGAGAFCIAGAAFDWDWFIESRKARLFLSLFGRTGTRAIYGALGTTFVILGTMVKLGMMSAK